MAQRGGGADHADWRRFGGRAATALVLRRGPPRVGRSSVAAPVGRGSAVSALKSYAGGGKGAFSAAIVPRTLWLLSHVLFSSHRSKLVPALED